VTKTSLAQRYAKALCGLVPEDKLDDIREELRALVGLVRESHEFYNLLNNETLKLSVRQSLLDVVLKKLEPPEVLFKFSHLLLHHGRISLIEKIVEQYDREADRRLGRMRGELLAPIEVPKEDVQALENRLKELLGADVTLSQRQDRTLLGGFMVRIEDWLFDATIDAELLHVRDLISGVLDSGHDDSSLVSPSRN
jgi:F-type H+-transporting ATPase subunit delta